MVVDRKFIGLTGTPYGCVNYDLLENHSNTKVVLFRNASKQAIDTNYNIIQYVPDSRKVNGQESLFQHLKSNHPQNGISVVFINDIIKTAELEQRLVEDKIVESDQVLRLNAKNVEDTKAAEMIVNQEIPSGIRIVISTSVMSTGINIKGEKIDNIYILYEPNLIEIIQFVFRFRNGVKNIYDFIPTKENTNEDLIDFKRCYYETESVLNKTVEGMNKYFPINSRKFWASSKRNGENIFGPYIYLNDSVIQVDRNRLQWNILQLLHSICYGIGTHRENYLRMYGFNSFNQEIDRTDYSLESDNPYSRLLKSEIEIKKQEIANLILENPPEVVTFFKSYLNYDLLKRDQLKELIIKTNYDRSACEKKFAELRRFAGPVIVGFCEFYSITKSSEISAKMCVHKHGGKVLKALEYSRFLYIKKSDFPYNISDKLTDECNFVYDLDRNLLNYTRTRDNWLPRNFRNSSSRFKEYFSKGTFSKFEFIYELKRVREESKGRKFCSRLSVTEIFKKVDVVLSPDQVKDIETYTRPLRSRKSIYY